MTLTNPSQVTTVFDKNIFPLLFVAVRLRKQERQVHHAPLPTHTTITLQKSTSSNSFKLAALLRTTLNKSPTT
ncbi:hypothetical protein LCAUW4_0434 [Lacticaseibacillus casei UW4]|nr:hypothetical protein LCAUW4_0434 [Lacticaseibacillus casei UW4]